MILSRRMESFKEGVFASLLAVKRARLAEGLDVIDMSVGSPNVPPASHIIDTLAEEAKNPANYVYAITDLAELREAAAKWYRTRFAVELDPETEITSLLGSQEGLGHISLAFADEGDVILTPDPCYPIFEAGPLLSGAKLHYMPMVREKNYIIDLRDIPEDTARAARLMIVSYPNNPTTALATPEFYRDLIAFAKEYDIVVLHDNAYSELVFDGGVGGSFLRYEGARDVGVEFNSLSKTYGIAGARVGFCLGNREVVTAVKNLKSNLDYGIFLPTQKAAIQAITGDQSCVRETREAYRRRRDVLYEGLRSAGWDVEKSAATMFMWARIPDKFESSMAFAMELVEKTGVMVTPGSAFGPSGEGFVRMAFVQNEDSISRAVQAIKESGILD